MRNKLGNKGSDFDELKNEKEKLDIKYENVCEKLRDTERKMKEDADEAKRRYEDLSRKLYNAEVNFKNELEQTIHKKDKEM